jgi:hypothetical protein
MQRFTIKRVINSIKYFNIISVLALILTSCAAPRAIIDSGKVTPKNQIKLGGNYAGNIPILTIRNSAEVVKKAVQYVNSNDVNTFTEEVSQSSVYDERYRLLNKYALSYFLDPFMVGYNCYVRYGIIKKVDIGYQYSIGTHAFDAKYQFLGTTGAIGTGEKNKNVYGSVGLQYSSREFSLPFGLDKIQNRIGLEFKRKDFFVPVIFSRSFGPEEKTGHFSWGVAYNHTFLQYGFKPKDIISENTSLNFPNANYKKNFASIGTFVNVKVGYKFVYFLAAFSMYYQNYGNFTLLDGSSVNLSGFTYVPSIGLQIVIPPIKKRKKE